jgi:gentisate 1,2-dioxygenase
MGPDTDANATAASWNPQVYYLGVVAGPLTIGSEQMMLGGKDIFVAPFWMEIIAETDLAIFWFSDLSDQKKLVIWRAG